ncbi:MAG: serine hydrolase [Dehalococcoidia bacterium]
MLALTLAACGGGGPPPEPTATVTASSTPIPPPATATAEPSPTAVPTPDATIEAEARCPDPYPGGAPYESEPGQPIRLQPLGTPPALVPFQPMSFRRDAALESIVRTTLGRDDEHFAVYIKNLADGRGIRIDDERQFYAASLFKTWVMLEAFHQRQAGLMDFAETYIVSDYYAALGLNPGELSPCSEVSLNSAMHRMMATTDNVAANLLLERAGAGNINLGIRTLGLEVSGFYQDDTLPTTAADMAHLLEAIVSGGAVDAAASSEMLELLLSEVIDDRIPARLPRGTQVAHKTGNWSTATHDAGIVFSPAATYVIVLLTDYGFQDNGAAPIAALSRVVYDYYN